MRRKGTQPTNFHEPGQKAACGLRVAVWPPMLQNIQHQKSITI